MFLYSHRKSRILLPLASSGPASFCEAQTETAAQAEEHRALVMPSGFLLCTADW